MSRSSAFLMKKEPNAKVLGIRNKSTAYSDMQTVSIYMGLCCQGTALMKDYREKAESKSRWDEFPSGEERKQRCAYLLHHHHPHQGGWQGVKVTQTGGSTLHTAPVIKHQHVRRERRRKSEWGVGGGGGGGEKREVQLTSHSSPLSGGVWMDLPN